MKSLEKIKEINQQIISCRKCPRLVEWRELIASQKKKAYKNFDYWGKPVPGFGDINGRILVIGLAPGAHGSNRTGRMFTGDASGDFLYPALYHAGFSNQPKASSADDEVSLKDLFITAVCRCAPPQNKPLKVEIENCRQFLIEEMHLMKNLQGVIALGSIAFYQAVSLYKAMGIFHYEEIPKFSHHALYCLERSSTPWLMASYHPSRQNTQTGRLTSDMFSKIWDHAKSLLW